MNSTAKRDVAITAPVGRFGLILFCSGLCALIFQIGWIREFRLFFGASTAAGGAVLAVFMGGLGLGNAILGGRCDRARNPLRIYAYFELGIAITAAISPALISLASWIYLQLGGQQQLGLLGATIVRLILAAAVLGPPTFLMGGTLPAAVRAVTKSSDTNRLSLSILYSTNTLGAVTGAAIASFLLLEIYGTRSTIWIAAAINFGLGIVAWYWSRCVDAGHESLEKLKANSARASTSKKKRRKKSNSVQPFAKREPVDLAPTQTPLAAPLVFAVAAITGFVFFLMELIWFRMLGPILGGSTYSFGLVLVVALFGIGLGSAAYRLLFRFLPVTTFGLAATCAMEALFLAVPIAMGDDLAITALRVRSQATSFSQLVWGWTQLTSIVVLPASFISGMQFPLLIALLGKGRDHVGRETGITFAFNTFGAIAGSLLGAFGILSWLSAPVAWKSIVLILAGLTVLLVAIAWSGSRILTGIRRLGSAVLPLTAASVAMILLMQEGPTGVWRHSGIGAGRADVKFHNHNSLQRWKYTIQRGIIWEMDGIESSIAIAANDGLALLVNGKSDGNSIGDAGTQIGLGMLGALLHPSPQRALVIGLGTGETAGWLADISPLQQVDVVELEPAVAEMARRCADVNRNVLENSKVRMIYNDAREVLLASQESYDLIVSEPSNPYRAGIATLYTQEYYAAAANRLADNGLFLQWLQAYEIDEMTVAIVLKTLRTAFKRVEIWQTKSRDLLLIASKTPPHYDEAHLRQRIREPVIHQALLQGWMVNDLEGVFAHFLAGQNLVDKLVSPTSVPVNTDDRTVLEFGFAKSVGRNTSFQLHRLRNAAVACGGHRPPLKQSRLKWDLVEQRRLAMHLISGDTVPLRPDAPLSQRQHAAAYAAFLSGDYQATVASWPNTDFPMQCPIELTVLLYSYADIGRTLPSDAMKTLAKFRPNDANAIQLLADYRAAMKLLQANRAMRLPYDDFAASLKSKFEALLASVERALEHLQSDPWGMPGVSDTTLRLLIDLSLRMPTAADRLYPLLQKPFAGYRFEELRRAVVVLVAEQLGSVTLVTELESLEPNVFWSASFLKTRAAAYRDAHHPLAGRAQRQWQEFRRNN